MNKYYPGIGRIEFRPDAGPEDTMVYRHYNPSEMVHGRTMEEWLKFSCSFFKTYRYMGGDDHFSERAHQRPWDDMSRSFENYKRRIQAGFEICHKLGLKYYEVLDRDLAPDFDNFEETMRMTEEMASMVYDLQKQTNMRCIYYGCDMFSHPRYANGSATNPDAHVFAYACAQLKHGLEVAKRLGAENFLFFNPCDGYQSLIQRQVFRDFSHLAQLYRMAVQYREKIGYRGQFMIIPKPNSPRRLQYESDAMTIMAFLRHFGLERHFKLFIKPSFSRMLARPYEHDVNMASAFNMLGAIGASDNWPEIMGPVDIAPYCVRDATSVMKCVLEQGGLQGGVSMSFRVRREAIEPRDHFHAHILAIDTFARALRNAARILSDGCFARNVQQRYITYKSGIGERLEKGSATLEECEEFVRKAGPPQPISSRYEHYENMFNFYVYNQLP